MTAQRLLGFPVLMLVAACATTGTSRRESLAPKDGPRARVHATYDGGLTNRMLRASFSVDQAAYVMVGHLSGKGQVEILYPENAMIQSRVRAKKTYRVRSVPALYDGVPQLFSFASRAYRNHSARMDSYDGRGNGFIFLIASQYPLDFDGLSSDGFWDTYEVEDYASSWDPRYAIRDLAERVTRGAPFTLDYADSFGTNAFTSYADMQMDCSILSGMGFGGFRGAFMPSIGWWGGGALMSSWAYLFREPMFVTNAYSSLNAGCGRGRYALGYGPRFWSWNSGLYRPTTPTLGVPSMPGKPTSPFVPPGFGRGTLGIRTGSETGGAVSLTRPRFGGGQTSTTTASWVPPVTRRPAAERYRPSRPTTSSPRTTYDAPSRPTRFDSPSSGSGRSDATRAAPVHQAPRFSPPPAVSAPAAPSPAVEAPHPGRPAKP